jgi:hypothetical protein
MVKGKSQPADTKYQRAINDIFDYIRHVCFLEGLSLTEGLGVLDVVKGSLKITIAKQQQALLDEEEEDDDE